MGGQSLEYHRLWRRKRVEEYRSITNKLKEDDGCSICKTKENLEYHHIDPSTKIKDISSLIVGGYSLEFIFKEIEKCEVLCHKCHKNLHKLTEEEKEIKRKEYAEKNREKMREYARDYKRRNKEKYRLKSKKGYHNRDKYKRKELREWVNYLKTNSGCKICQGKINLYYIHRKDESDNIPIYYLISGLKSKERILEEINKCDVFCISCRNKYL